MIGRPRLYDRRVPVTTTIQGIFYDLAREKHISWKLALEAGIKLLAQGGESPKLNQETIQKHIKIEKQMVDIIEERDDELEKIKKELQEKCGLKKEEQKNKNKFHY